jgi:hypothetical protein
MVQSDYVKMFELKPEEYALKILVCAEPQTEKILSQCTFVGPDLLSCLSFDDYSFDLVLCPKMSTLDEKALLELTRVGGEIRIFPVIEERTQSIDRIGAIIQFLQQQQMDTELRHLTMQEGHSNVMLRIWGQACRVTEKQAK